MPVIAIAYYDTFSKKFKALTCACTQQEYETYMKTGDINEYQISRTFLREYLSLSGYAYEKLSELEEKASIKTQKAIFY